MNNASEFEGFSVWLYAETPSQPAVVNNEPFTLGDLATVLVNLVNSGASEDDWQHTAACLRTVLAPGKGTVARSLASYESYDAAFELNFNVVSESLLTPAQGTVVVLRNKAKFTYASLTLALNPLMLSGSQEVLDRIEYDLYWAALLCCYDVDTAREAGDPESGTKLIVFENATTHCSIRSRSRKPADVWFFVKTGLFGQT